MSFHRQMVFSQEHWRFAFCLRWLLMRFCLLAEWVGFSEEFRSSAHSFQASCGEVSTIRRTKVICDVSEQYDDQAMRATPYRFLC